MTWLIEDRSRLDAFRQGQREALTETYLHYAAPLAERLRHGFSFQSAGRAVRFRGFQSPCDLDETVQEVFVRALSAKSRAAYGGVQPFIAYLVAIGRNLIIDRLRRERFQVFFEDDGPWGNDTNGEEHALDEAPDPESKAIDAQLRRLYEEFVSTLDETDRLLVRLRFEEDHPRRLVSERTGLSAMQVRVRERKIREALHERLLAGGYGPPEASLVLLLALVAARTLEL